MEKRKNIVSGLFSENTVEAVRGAFETPISSNYSDWIKTIRLYLRSIRMTSHLDKDPPTDDSKDRWLEDDARLFLQIRNSIDGKVLTLINHCEYVKELMEYLEFVYSGKGIFLAYSMYVKPFIALRKKIGSSRNSSWTIRRYMRN